MREYVVISVEPDLLPDVLRGLLAFTDDPNQVDVVHGAAGRVIHAAPEVAEAWYAFINNVQPEPLPLPEPTTEPVADAPVQAPVKPPAAVGPVLTGTARGTVTTPSKPPLNTTARK